MPKFFRFNIHQRQLLWENRAVWDGRNLYVSNAAFQLVADDPEIRQEVINGLLITTVEPPMNCLGDVQFYDEKSIN